MADNSMDVDNFESADMEAVSGGGGYVDDDIHIDDDDDDDDEPLVTAQHSTKISPKISPKAPPPKGMRAKPLPTVAAAARSKKRTRPPLSKLEPRPMQRSRIEKPADVRPTDFKLRAASMQGAREFLVAHFRQGSPTWKRDGVAQHVRMYRRDEHTVNERAQAVKDDQKELTQMGGYMGQRREARRAKQGLVTVRRRMQKQWHLEVASKDVAQKLVDERQTRVDKRVKRGEEGNGANAANGEDANASASAANDETDPTTDELKKQMSSYTGHFDGRTSSRYAIMVMNASDRTVDVIPVEVYSMFSFRPHQSGAVKSIEEVEMLSKKMREMREKSSRMGMLNDRVATVQFAREHAMGDGSRLKSNPDFYEAGIKRGGGGRQGGGGGRQEGMDFDHEFDNDDQFMVDKEELPKAEDRKVVLADQDEQARMFRKMIKDEKEEVSQDKGNRSDSDEDTSQQGEGAGKGDGDTQTDSAQASPREASPRDGTPASASTASAKAARERGGGAAASAANGRATPVSRAVGSMGNVSPSSNATPRGNTPQMLDLSHLLPPAGTQPNDGHVTAVLSALTKDRGRQTMPFKELMRYFSLNTTEQKKHVMAVLKRVAVVMSDADKKRGYLVSLKPGVKPGV